MAAGGIDGGAEYVDAGTLDGDSPHIHLSICLRCHPKDAAKSGCH